MGALINTDKSIIEAAKLVACKIDDTELRKRTYALNIAANAAARYLNENNVIADTKQSLYKVPSFARNIELADIYVNGVRYDVRVTFDGKSFCIPKIQEKYDAVPAAYIVVQLENSLKEVEILGFIPSEKLTDNKANAEYYCYSTDILLPIEEFGNFAQNQSVKIHPFSSLDHDKIKEMCTGFIDDEITETEKIYFIKHVIACPVCRETFCDMNDFDTILSQLKNYHELLNDSTLSVFSGNKEEFDAALIAGMGVVENAIENTVVEPEVLQEEDILEEQEPQKEQEQEEEEDDELVLEEIQEEAQDEENEQEQKAAIDTIENENILESDIPAFDLIDFAQIDAEPELLQEEDILEEQEPQKKEEQEQEEELEADIDTVENEEAEEVATLAQEPDEVIEEPEEIESIDESESIDPIESVEELESIGELDNLAELEELEETEPETLEEPLELLSEDNDLLELGDEPTVDESEIEEPIMDEPAIEEPLEEQTDSYQEPVELKYDDEETEEIEQDIEQEEENPQELPAMFDFAKATADIETEPDENQSKQDEEIQGLLDDDLLALLSDSDTEDTEEQEETQSYESQEFTQEPEQEYDQPSEFESEEFEQPEFSVDTQESQPLEQDGDDTIHSLFENQANAQSEEGAQDGVAEFELAPEPVSASTVNKTKQIAVAAALVVLLAGAGAGAWFMNHQKATTEETPLDTANSDQLFDFQNQGTQSEESPDTQSAAVSQDINRSMANSFSDKPAAISITKLSWQVSEKLASEASVKEYLQTAGKNIQMNLQNDLANASDVAFNNTVKVSFEIAPDNTLKGIQVLTSSGSDKIDDIILRSIKNTLKYINVPKLKDYKSDYFLTLIINF
ncbi:MAG TPA: hypothetical protein IAD26_08920 [Candidatus Limenecus avicola]|uniref:Zinc-finger domain-containing protein n=1 Tax=Candidatus Limenecus avicola TaxID=2840847 RepID=A0A9D1SSK4_9CLOT|nr:hypothetical protein [Candidatus Limenecus avicola]